LPRALDGPYASDDAVLNDVASVVGLVVGATDALAKDDDLLMPGAPSGEDRAP
jgi:hypothetical protein